MNNQLRKKIEKIISENIFCGEECGMNYYGKKGWQCRCGKEELVKGDVDKILSLFKSEILRIIKEAKPTKPGWEIEDTSKSVAHKITWNDACDEYEQALRGGVKQGMRIRRLTPIECERLQGFLDNCKQRYIQKLLVK